MGKRAGSFGSRNIGSVGNAGENVDGIGSVGESTTGESDGSIGIAAVDDRGTESTDAGDGTQFVDPASAGDNSSAGTGTYTGKRRGRKPGSKNKSRASATQATADISGILFTAHLFMAKLAKSDVLEITKEESEELGAAITRVSQLYEVPLLSEKHMAWLNLAMVSGNIYGTRLMVLSMNKKQSKNNVVDMPFQPVQATVNA